MAAEVLSYLLEMVFGWLNLFAAPFINENLLWVIIPVYLNWILAEFYSEKIGISFAGMITKGIVLIWVGIDWTRTATSFLKVDVLGLILFKYILCFFLVSLGIFLVVQGIRKKKIVKFVGRSRNITYFTLVFTPIFYNIVPLSIEILLVIVLFFPVYYLIVEILDKIIPDPKIGREDENEEKKSLVPLKKVDYKDNSHLKKI